MTKENKAFIVKIIRSVLEDKRKINFNDVLIIVKKLKLNSFENTRVCEIKVEVEKYIDNKILYFEKIENPLKIEEYVKVKKYSNRIFEFFLDNRDKFILENPIKS